MGWKKITKERARHLFDNSETIYMLASKLNPDNGWFQPSAVSNANDDSFDSVVNAYHYYNCNHECGKGIVFYLPVEE